jgi:hypothetical protein
MVEFCHCDSCRRGAGAPLMAWAAFGHENFETTSGDAVAYRSSPGVTRTFCGRCGTSLTIADDRFGDEIYIATAAFDAPEALPPAFHIWRSERLSWLETADDLPRYVAFKSDGKTE